MADGRLKQLLDKLHKVAEREGGAGLSDRDLLQRHVQQNDAAAFTDLVERHGRIVLGVVVVRL